MEGNKMNKISIELDNGLRLTAQANMEPGYNEIFVDLEDSCGRFYQSLAVVGQEYEYSDDSDMPVPLESFSVKIYGDCMKDDFTEEVCHIPLAVPDLT